MALSQTLVAFDGKSPAQFSTFFSVKDFAGIIRRNNAVIACALSVKPLNG